MQKAEKDPFAPVLRFAVCSDLHIKEDGDISVQRLRQLMQRVSAVAAASSSYPRVDAFLFAGDLADRGTPAQFQAFWNAVEQEKTPVTTVLACVARNHDNWEHGRNGKKTGLSTFRKITGLSTDTHLVLNGFHFIAISTCEKKRRYYDRKQKKWLKKALRQAAQEKPLAPIFVMQHEHVKETVFGSSAFDGWGNDSFKKILSRYPQVIHFSGHSHYPLNDPRSIWQGEFTAVGTGALRYAELTVKNERTVHPPLHEQISQGWIIEADAQNRVRLYGYDFLSGILLCSYQIDAPASPEAFTFRPKQQCARAKAPAFSANAALQIQTEEANLIVTVPAAESADGFPVVLYRLQAFGKANDLMFEAKEVPPYWLGEKQPYQTFTLPKLPQAQRIRVFAENAYDMCSDSIESRLEGSVWRP